ncbi:hypothetical protein [Hyalangium rubrum]|uniref:Glycosyltransferase RgtA/B/C/D-like domain-containing protein n=1 Tax=Hyalangium rubrum TaxID=3103134 RepID=A0ABU5HAP3_9BACT|nr:hypothetical protein [Hyalangium sp. s54d21]MDY7230381.1 hypothetical protein [Hyalangium sp. s54d21]
MRAHRAALFALIACLIPYAVLLLGFPASGDQDAAIHAIYSRWPTAPNPAPFPYRLLTVWSRPLFATLYAVPGQLGYAPMRLFTVLLCASTGWLTYLLARRLSLPRPWLAVPLTMLQPVLLQVGTDVMTEALFALVLAAGFLALESGRRLLAAALWSFLPLARPEGAIILGVLAALWGFEALRDRRALLPLLMLGLGAVLWELTVLALTGNWRYLLDTFPWPVHGTQWSGPPFHYLLRWPLIVGFAALVPWLVGLRPSWRAGGTARLSVLFCAVVLVIHALLFTTGGFASTGFDRYFATLVTSNALIALTGVAWLEERFPRLRAKALLPALLGLQAVQGLVLVELQPLSHLPKATLHAIQEARSRVELAQPLVASDFFTFVFLDLDPGGSRAKLPVSREGALARIAELPTGTVVIWDNLIGQWWYGLATEDFTARGYEVLWERDTALQSSWLSFASSTPLRQTVLVRRKGPP